MSAAQLIVGLGNPGAEYAKNRHNIGFMAVDALHAAHGFSAWKRKFRGEAAEGAIGGVRALLLKPLTYMNLSGNAVQQAMEFYRLAPGDVFVLHDEIELAPGKVRIKQGGGAAGHNGLKSIQSHIGPGFWRVRLGVGRPSTPQDVHDYVLSNFARAELTWVGLLCDTLAQEAPLLTGGKHSALMNKLALALFPPEKKGKKEEENEK
ncbi:MAG: aminoacyl-tRNA hydrolase [Alphaproteobacteria bacterium]|nr:aminoacyl-tRNA hydrolase [Alphaproteobacteria bacterium]